MAAQADKKPFLAWFDVDDGGGAAGDAGEDGDAGDDDAGGEGRSGWCP